MDVAAGNPLGNVALQTAPRQLRVTALQFGQGNPLGGGFDALQDLVGRGHGVWRGLKEIGAILGFWRSFENCARSAPSGTSSLILLLALILLRSLATPDKAWAAITQGIVNIADGTSNIDNAATCIARPMFIVLLRPIRAPNQPPTRLVMTPKIS